MILLVACVCESLADEVCEVGLGGTHMIGEARKGVPGHLPKDTKITRLDPFEQLAQKDVTDDMRAPTQHLTRMPLWVLFRKLPENVELPRNAKKEDYHRFWVLFNAGRPRPYVICPKPRRPTPPSRPTTPQHPRPHWCSQLYWRELNVFHYDNGRRQRSRTLYHPSARTRGQRTLWVVFRARSPHRDLWQIASFRQNPPWGWHRREYALHRGLHPPRPCPP
jgi:hypothetical protein